MKTRSLTACFAFCLLGVFAADTTQAAKPVGVIAQVDGKVRITRDKQERVARLYGILYAGDRLTLGGKASVSVAFRDDGHIEKLATGTTSVEKTGFKPKGVSGRSRPQAESALIASTIAKLPENTIGGVHILRSKPQSKQVHRIEPIDGSLVIDGQPTFQWPQPGGREESRVVVRAGRRLIWKTQTDDGEVVYAGKPLMPGRTFHWAVTLADGMKIVSGSFTVATPEQQQLVKDWDKLQEQADATLLSVAALHFANEGMIAQAIELYERIVELQPQNGEFHLALGHLYGRAGRSDEAGQHYSHAEQLGVTIEAPEGE